MDMEVPAMKEAMDQAVDLQWEADNLADTVVNQATEAAPNPATDRKEDTVVKEDSAAMEDHR